MNFLSSLSAAARSSLPRALRGALVFSAIVGPIACGGLVDDPNARGQGGDHVSCQGDCPGQNSPDRPVNGSPGAPTASPTSTTTGAPPASPTAAPTSTPTATPTGTTTASPPGDPPVPVVPAVAITRAQLQVLWGEDDGSGGEGGTSGGGPDPVLDPDDLFLQASDVGVSCSSSYVALPCGGHWSISVAVPPAQQKVGVYDLSSPELQQFSSMSESGQPYSDTPGDCGWGGGSLGGGTLEILAIDAAQVTFRLQMPKDGLWQTDPSGTYTASRCGQ